MSRCFTQRYAERRRDGRTGIERLVGGRLAAITHAEVFEDTLRSFRSPHSDLSSRKRKERNLGSAALPHASQGLKCNDSGLFNVE